MSLEELTLRNKIHKNIKLFLQEKKLGVTLDKIYFGSFEYDIKRLKHNYPTCRFKVYDRIKKYHYFINYVEVKKYFEKDRKDYLILQERARIYLTALRNNGRRCGKNFVRLKEEEKI